MLETDSFKNKSSTNIEANSNSGEANIEHNFLYGEMEIPFIHFFKQSFLNGMFKNLEDIERIKKNNPTYASYIDRWLTEALSLKFITLDSKGKVNIDSKLLETYSKLDITLTQNANKLRNSVINEVSNIAYKDLKKDKSDSFSSLTYFICPKDIETQKDICEAFSHFYKTMNEIAGRSKLEKKVDELLYVAIATSAINEEVLDEL